MASGKEQVSGEEALIARFFKPLAGVKGALALSDDAALLAPPSGCDLVLTTDALVAGVHFFADDEAGAVARKALRVNLSDLAAKGAAPIGYLLSLALPPQAGDDWLTAFAAGLASDAERYLCPLYGGDSVRTPGPLTISIAMIGSVPSGAMVRRAGAEAGDLLFVSGSIGDAALGLALRQGAAWPLGEAHRRHLLERYLLPQPQLALAEALRRHASAAMDLSDGLAGDLAKLARVSQVGAEVECARVPLSDAARAALVADPALLTTILTGGDDYEILCAVPPDQAEAFRAAAGDTAVTEIGRIGAEPGTRFLDAGGKALVFAKEAFSHF